MPATTAANLRRLRVLVGIAVLAAALLSVTPATPAVNSELFPVADSYASALHENDGHGDLPFLRADDQPRRIMYLKFDVVGFRAGSTAALKLWIEKRTRTGLEVRGADNGWDEASLTFENAPVPGPVAAESGPLPRESWISIDVTSLVTADGEVTLALTTTNENSINVPSREADPSLRPRLVVVSPDPEPEPVPLSPFTVTAAGSLYQASSAAGVTYTGTLKTVVESAAGDLSRAGGGVVRFGAGTFDLERESFRFVQLANVTFEGAGPTATEIRNSSLFAVDSEIFDLSRTSKVTLRDMTLRADGDARATSDAIDLDGAGETLIERVRITASRASGIVADGKDVAEVPLSAENNIVRDCTIAGVPGDGIQLLAASNNRVEGCTITSAGGRGIAIVKSSSVAGQPNKKPTGNVVADNLVQGSGGDGIHVTSGDGNQILRNTVLNSASALPLSSGIKIQSTDAVSAEKNVVSGNSASDNRAPKQQRYGLNMTGPLVVETSVGTNNFAGNLLGPINDLGTGTLYETPTDVVPPDAPADLTATVVSATRVDLSWSAAQDNEGVAGYSVYRDGDPIGTVGGSTLAFSDTNAVASTTYSYTVDAFDAAGNRSAQSTAASATTPAGNVVVTFVAEADTYVGADDPTANYGGGIELRTDASPVRRTFLRFTVSGVTGTPTSVKLRIYANSSSSAGFDVHLLGGPPFDEMTVTDATAPTVGDVIRRSSAFGAGAYTEVDVTPSITGNGTYELALIALGDTATSFGSRESDNKPQLVVEYTP
jgi:parallel beta-helix repeat protein